MATSEEVLAYGQKLAAQYGLRIGSHVRTPERNRAVGGAKNSDHLTGLALDLSGDPEKMHALGSWAKANMGPGKLFRWVGWQTKGHYDHVHLSFNEAADMDDDVQTVVAQQAQEAVMAEVDELPPDATPEQITAYIQKNYPQATPFLSNEEIRGILVRPDIDEMDELEVEALLRNTNYWRTHGPESREFDRLIALEPIKAGQAVDNAKGALADTFAKLGVPVTDEQLGTAAKEAIRAGWINLEGQVANSQKLNDFAGLVLRQQPRNLDQGNLPEGEAAYNADQLAVLAKQYGVPLSRPTVEGWVVRMLEGSATEEGFRSYLTNRAKETWQNDPDVIRHLDSGGTAESFFDSHRETIAKILEIDPAQIDLFDDPRWKPVTQHYDGEKRRAMTLSEVADLAREDDRYGKTRAAKEAAAQYSRQILQTFGRIAA